MSERILRGAIYTLLGMDHLDHLSEGRELMVQLLILATSPLSSDKWGPAVCIEILRTITISHDFFDFVFVEMFDFSSKN